VAGLSVVAKYETIKTKDWPMTGEETLLLSSLYKMDMMEFWEGEIPFLSLFIFPWYWISIADSIQRCKTFSSSYSLADLSCWFDYSGFRIFHVPRILFREWLIFPSVGVKGDFVWRLEFASFSDWFCYQGLSSIIRGGLSFSFITVAPVVRAHHCSS